MISLRTWNSCFWERFLEVCKGLSAGSLLGSIFPSGWADPQVSPLRKNGLLENQIAQKVQQQQQQHLCNVRLQQATNHICKTPFWWQFNMLGKERDNGPKGTGGAPTTMAMRGWKMRPGITSLLFWRHKMQLWKTELMKPSCQTLPVTHPFPLPPDV